MNDCFKIIVYILEHMLHYERPLFDKLTEINICMTDGIRRTELSWSKKNGVSFK